jgi:hypothetical protein
MICTEWWATFLRCAALLHRAANDNLTLGQWLRAYHLRDDGVSPYAAAAEIFA